MTNKIGPTFFDECKRAGVSLEGWSVGIETGEFLFMPDVPQETRDALHAVLAAHDPTKTITDPVDKTFAGGNAWE